MSIFNIIIGIIIFLILIWLILITGIFATKDNKLNENQSKLIEINKSSIEQNKKLINDNKKLIDDNKNAIKALNGNTSDISYLYDNNAEIYFGSALKGVYKSNYKFNCSAYGFYNKKDHRANITTNNMFVDFNIVNQEVLAFIGIKVNGVMFYAKKYPYLTLSDNLNDQNGNKINTSYFTNEYPFIVGNIEVSSSQSQIWHHGTDVQNKWIFYLHPTAYDIKIDDELYPSYTVRNSNGEIDPWTEKSLIVRFINLDLVDTKETYTKIQK